jgi:hypothetical protein
MLTAQSSPVSGFVFVVAVLATSIVLVAALAWASRQLLGLPVGTLRAFYRRIARRARWSQGRPHRQPLSDNRLQPAHRRRHPRPAAAVHDLQEPVG